MLRKVLSSHNLPHSHRSLPIATSSSTANAWETIALLWRAWCDRKYPTYLLLALCFNAVLAPAVMAATGEALSRSQAYALGLLGLVMVALSGYLFVVMFQPERF